MRSTVHTTVSVSAARSYWPVVGHQVALAQRTNSNSVLMMATAASSSLYDFSSRMRSVHF